MANALSSFFSIFSSKEKPKNDNPGMDVLKIDTTGYLPLDEITVDTGNNKIVEIKSNPVLNPNSAMTLEKYTIGDIVVLSFEGSAANFYFEYNGVKYSTANVSGNNNVSVFKFMLPNTHELCNDQKIEKCHTDGVILAQNKHQSVLVKLRSLETLYPKETLKSWYGELLADDPNHNIKLAGTDITGSISQHNSCSIVCKCNDIELRVFYTPFKDGWTISSVCCDNESYSGNDIFIKLPPVSSLYDVVIMVKVPGRGEDNLFPLVPNIKDLMGSDMTLFDENGQLIRKYENVVHTVPIDGGAVQNT